MNATEQLSRSPTLVCGTLAVSRRRTDALAGAAGGARILYMESLPLADVRAQLSKYVEQVVSTHERVTITRNGKPAAVLISAEDLEAMQETLYWSSQRLVDEGGDTVGLDEVLGDLQARDQEGSGSTSARR